MEYRAARLGLRGTRHLGLHITGGLQHFGGAFVHADGGGQEQVAVEIEHEFLRLGWTDAERDRRGRTTYLWLARREPKFRKPVIRGHRQRGHGDRSQDDS